MKQALKRSGGVDSNGMMEHERRVDMGVSCTTVNMTLRKLSRQPSREAKCSALSIFTLRLPKLTA